MKSWLYFIIFVFIWSACDSKNPIDDDGVEGGTGEGPATSGVTIQFTLSVYGEIETRAGGRPLYSSEGMQAVKDVKVYYFRADGEDWVYAGNRTMEGFEGETSASTKQTVKIEEELPDGKYKFVAVGFEEGYENIYTLPALQEGETTLDHMILSLKNGQQAEECFVGISTAVTVAQNKAAYAILQLRRAVAGVFGYFKNIPCEIKGTPVKSLAIRSAVRGSAVSLSDLTPSGSGEGENLLVLDLSSASNNGSVFTCSGEPTGKPAKEANTWIVGGYSLPVEAVNGQATLIVDLCSDVQGQTPLKSWQVRILDSEENMITNSVKSFPLEANMFYGMGIKTSDADVLETDAPVDLSTAQQIVINKKVYELAAPAFPTAVGFGAKTTGARGVASREVYHVTNLNTSGEGSIFDAVSQEGRFIVFDVAGVIDLNKKELVFKSNQTVLFHTAPGDGIELYNGRITASGASNLIVRYCRVRLGRQASGSDNLDAGGIANGQNIIFDHCSFTWGLDENFSINPDNKGSRPRNITLQNSIIGQGCMNHSAGGLMQTNTDEGVTVFRNLLIDNHTRNFKVKGLNQYVNNVVYNWGSAAYNMGGESAGASVTAIENNYFIKGPCWVWTNTGVALVDPDIINDPEKCCPADNSGKYYEVLAQGSPARPFTGGNADFTTYCVGNYYDYDKNGTLNGIEITQANWGEYCDGSPTFAGSRPAAIADIPEKTSAEEAYHWIVDHVGASLPARDKVDAYMIEELTSLGTKGIIFRNQRNLVQYPLADTWQNINTSGTKSTDTDKDGIPDWFEDAHGLDKNDPSDALSIAPNGYTHLENYIFIEIEKLDVDY